MAEFRSARWLLCAALLSAGVPAAARADEKDAIRDGVAAGFARLFDSMEKAGYGCTDYDSIDVYGSATPFDVTIPGIGFCFNPREDVRIDRLRFRAWGLGQGLYRVSDVEVASPVTRIRAATGALPLLDIGRQSMGGIWSAPLQNLVAFEADLGDLVVHPDPDTGLPPVSVARATVHDEQRQIAPGRWAGSASFDATGIAVEAGSTTVEIGSFEVCAAGVRIHTQGPWSQPQVVPESAAPTDGSTAAGICAAAHHAGTDTPDAPAASGIEPIKVASTEMAAVEPASDAATQPDAAAGDDAMRDMPASLENVVSEFAVRGLSIHTPELDWTVGAIELEGSGGDPEQPGTMRLAFRIRDMTGGTPHHQGVFQLFAPLIPTDLTLDLRLEGAPMQELASAYVAYARALAAGGERSAAIAAFTGAVSQSLERSGSTLRLVDSSVVSDALEVKLSGSAQIDGTAPKGITGTLQIDIAGIDAAMKRLESAKDDVHTRHMMLMLGLLRVVGIRQMQDDTPVDHFDLSLDHSGATLLNGKDVAAIFSALK